MEKEGDSSDPEGLCETLISRSMKMSNGSGQNADPEASA